MCNLFSGEVVPIPILLFNESTQKVSLHSISAQECPGLGLVAKAYIALNAPMYCPTAQTIPTKRTAIIMRDLL
jgi:hypothetical protein